MRYVRELWAIGVLVAVYVTVGALSVWFCEWC